MLLCLICVKIVGLNSHTLSFTLPLTHSLTHSFTHSLLHSLTHSLIHSLTYSSTRDSAHCCVHYRLSPARPHSWMQSFTNCHKQNIRGTLHWMNARTVIAVKVRSWIGAPTVCNLLPTDSFAGIGVLRTKLKISWVYFIGRSWAVVAHHPQANEEIAPCYPKTCVTCMD